jgi:mevalonate kinase
VKVIAEAPGKVIITGEHFVVHGALALAAALGQKTRVEASPSRGLNVESPVSRNRPSGSAPTPVERLIWEMYRERGREPGVRLSISSELPPGAGLGSSASTMVAAVAAVSRLEGWNLDPNSIIETAMMGERIVHGKPSGIDVAVSAMGGVLQFRVGEDPRRVSVPKPVRLVVVYSGERRSSKRLISKVSSMKQVYPHLFASLCQSATLMTELATERFLDGRLDELGRIMTYNHAVLGMVGASNSKLDRLVDLCLEYGCFGAKLTGAGGGGSVIGVVDRQSEETLAAQLVRRGFSSFVTEVPSGGVRVWASD